MRGDTKAFFFDGSRKKSQKMRGFMDSDYWVKESLLESESILESVLDHFARV